MVNPFDELIDEAEQESPESEPCTEEKWEEKEDAAKRDLPKYFALASKASEECTLIVAKTWGELNELVEKGSYQVHRIIKGREVPFCTKLVISPK